MKLIYKVLTQEQFAQVEAGGPMQAPVDVADGFVHFSTARQLAGTLEKWFRGQQGLVLLAVDSATVAPDLRWEPSRGGDLFPHVYGRVGREHVLQRWSLQTDASGVPEVPTGVSGEQ